MGMKIVGLLGSPRTNGVSAKLLGLLDSELKTAAPQAEFEQINLASLKISSCTGCDACLKGDCPLDKDDDYPKIVNALLASDALVIASPVYFFNVPGILKNFIDRSRRMKMNRNQLKNKWFATIVASGLRNGGAEMVSMLLTTWALSQGMLPVSSTGNPVIENGLVISTMQKDKLKEFRKAGEEDEIAEKVVKRLAERLVELINITKKTN